MYQRCILDLPYAEVHEVARNLNVDPSTVCRTVKLFEETDCMFKYPFKKLTAHNELAILDVLDKPSTHLREVQQHLLQTTGTDVCIATLCNLFPKCWIYPKKANIKGPTKK